MSILVISHRGVNQGLILVSLEVFRTKRHYIFVPVKVSFRVLFVEVIKKNLLSCPF